jgi:5-methyltetrahydrofolate--homocysteine methyltransferase
LPVDERLARRIIDGDQNNIVSDLDEALADGARPLDIINDFLLEGMRVVGDRFASGEMQLPFVLKSAETMKKAVAYLEPMMEKAETSRRGSVVLATVSGDVHDIGKNLVDIILSNNGYEVHNLGIKVGISEMIQAYEEKKADAIGMSGLLVKSTLIMKDNLDELDRRGMGKVPVLLGGAALTRSYVEADLRSLYPGPLYYGKNAFAGLEAMGHIVAGDPSPAPAKKRERPAVEAVQGEVPRRSPSVASDNPIFEPPFLGARVVRNVALDDVVPFLNLTALFRNQWQYRPESGEKDAEFKERLAPLLREQLALARTGGLLQPQVVYGYFAANGDGDELVLWKDRSRQEELTRFGFPRQHEDPYLSIPDFFRPMDEEVDYAAFHIVTMGAEVSRRAAELFEANEYTAYLHLHGLGVEMAEALAEYWHHRIRTEWGFVDEDGPSLTGLFRQKYRGGRYSWGYPACPDLEDNERVADILGADRIGISVGAETSYQYQPEQTTSAIICHHPQAKYFIAKKPREVRSADRS